MEITDDARNRMFSNEDLVRLIIPLIIEQMLTVTVGLADSIMTEPSLQGSFSDREKISWHVRQQTS